MGIRDIVESWQGRPTFAVVDLDALATNIKTLRAHVRPEASILAVVKANGYGHGAVPVAETVLENGAYGVAVATVDEGAQLRKAGISAPILAMGPMGAAERGRAVGLDMAIVMSDVPFAAGLARSVRMHQRTEPIKVHLKVDTGMRRFGVPPESVVESARAIMQHPELKLEGLMTHLACADELDLTSAHEQVNVFDRCVGMLSEAGIEIPVHHVANSATTVQFSQYHKNLVRSGLALYGVRPAPHIPLPGGERAMKQILTIHGMVTRVIPLAPGDRVGYGGAWVAKEKSRGALVPIGYADGYLRSLSSKGWMTVSGERANVIGRVCMDQTILQMPDSLPGETRQPVVIVGNGTDETPGAPTLETLAEMAGTIPHELMTGLAPRLPKLYIKGGRLFAVDDLEGYRRV
ncbi:MAG TPA: alanine racemase [Thermomicrobiales bacterium]|nr:alanine racemase [Thermomicrobiales bacterium]